MPVLPNPDPSQLLSNVALFDVNDTTQWTWVTPDESPDEDRMAYNRGSATMVGYVEEGITSLPNWQEMLWAVVAYFLGFSYTNGTQMHRSLPAYHPRWPWMWCSGLSVRGVNYDSTEYWQVLKYADSMPLTRYKRYRFQLNFDFPDYTICGDDQITTEWDRFLTVNPYDETEIVIVDGGTYKYRHSTNANIDGKPVTVNGPSLRVYAQRTGLTIVAKQIPANFVMDENNLPLHFLDASKKVNSATFLGRPAGTMLLKNYRFIKYPQTVATSDPNALLFGVDIEMNFSYTNPKHADSNETENGWQLWPSIYGTKDGWLYAYNSQNGTGDGLYDTYDMYRLLQHWST